MPTDAKVEVTLCLTDGTKLTRIEDLADVTTFLEQHEEFVKVVRCKDCRYNYANMIPNGKGCQQNVYIETADNWYCADGEREEEVEE